MIDKEKLKKIIESSEDLLMESIKDCANLIKDKLMNYTKDLDITNEELGRLHSNFIYNLCIRFTAAYINQGEKCHHIKALSCFIDNVLEVIKDLEAQK